MSDQRVWVKLWLSWLMDRDIQALSYADKGRWIELLLLVAEHGSAGDWLCPRGVASLPSAWRRGMAATAVLTLLTTLPGIVIHRASDRVSPPPPPPPPVPSHYASVPGLETPPRNADTRPVPMAVHSGSDPLQPFVIRFVHWDKYQLHSSTERVRRWRSGRVSDGVTKAPNETPHYASNETGERRREKKRPPTPVTGETFQATSQSRASVAWDTEPDDQTLDRGEACRIVAAMPLDQPTFTYRERWALLWDNNPPDRQPAHNAWYARKERARRQQEPRP